MDAFSLLNEHADVSREAFGKLSDYHDLLVKWQAKVNLVSPETLKNAWQRHFLDSLQLIKLLPKNLSGSIFDLGSGAGFPGLVISIVTGREVNLIESDMKKCIFMKEAARITGARVRVHTCRIEDYSAEKASVITSRALADLSLLLSLSQKIVSRETICLFPKGKNYAMELDQAKREWSFDCIVHPSITDPSGVILEISNIAKQEIS
ncbi:MAG: 16S rRNA (guanine(527)-N(7))-methyltransferase RsmG [Alphaproteobacteria bacterium]|nr:16S rRNA (guanine(527)-N(7))-methyltransferase RsmG [Alphaproteobacteria bacterium]